MSLWAALSGAVAAILTVVGAYLHGRKMGAQAASERALRDQVETRERIDDATIDNDLSLADRFLNHRLRKDADR